MSTRLHHQWSPRATRQGAHRRTQPQVPVPRLRDAMLEAGQPPTTVSDTFSLLFTPRTVVLQTRHAHIPSCEAPNAAKFAERLVRLLWRPLVGGYLECSLVRGQRGLSRCATWRAVVREWVFKQRQRHAVGLEALIPLPPFFLTPQRTSLI